MKPFRVLAILSAAFVVAPFACAGSQGTFTNPDAGEGEDSGGNTCSAAGTIECAGSCVDPQTDDANCGKCGNACPTGTSCKNAACACADGQTACGGKCVDTDTDNANCGMCGHACTGTNVCSSGACAATCTGGLTLCEGSCTNTMTDPKNCGGCGAPCMAPTNATSTCADSKCSYACTMGYVDVGEGGLVEGGADCNCHDTATKADPDLPDTSFQDTNCDGIDGTIASAIFVATTGSDGNPGTIGKPVQTIKQALTLASAASPVKDVYVSLGTYTEAVTLVPGVGIYGGYDATSGWSRALTNATVIQSPGSTAVTGLSLDSSVTLQLLSITAAEALTPGGSSYGILISNSSAGATVTVEACSVTAGAGQPGTAGAGGSSGSGGGTGATGDQSQTAAKGGTSTCGGTGGAGGAAVSGGNVGKSGQNGLGPAPGMGGTGGTSAGSCGGSGGTGALANTTTGGSGGNGSNGVSSSAVGTLASGGYQPGTGNDGTTGANGSGGGGGGSGAGDVDVCVAIPPCCDQTSGGGGGGGGGGCSGTLGKGGTGGGGSFAIVAVQSTLDIEGCQLGTAAGGTGGPGGAGGAGGTGGFGGPGTTGTGSSGAGAAGAQGGNGGASGAGSGGNGGPSVCIAYSSSFKAPTENMNTCNAPSSGGAGGAGGFSSILGPASPGLAGPAGTVLAL